MQQSVHFYVIAPSSLCSLGNQADQNAWCSGKEKIHFWGKDRQDDWQKEFMGC